MKRFSAAILFHLLGVALLGVAGVSLLRAQIPQGLSGKKISFAYQDPKDSKLKAIFTGENAKQLTGSLIQISGFEMTTFRNGDTNQIELIVQAPECLMDRGTSVASSPGRLRAYTGNTNLFIEGEGFFCQQTNALLIISNKVETTIRKDLLKSKSGEKTSQQVTPSFSDSTNQVLKIYADYFQFLYESNLVTYTGNVRVDDEQMELACDVLNIQLTTNKSVRQITAENRVVIINKKDNSRATGDWATYIVNTNQEFMELTGNPVWRGGEHEGKADLFVFDRRNNVFRAEKNAIFKLPSEKIGQPELLNLNAPTATEIQPGKLVTISADLMTFQLPETNGPVREIIAEGNVVIANERDESRATGDKAVYNEATGLVELTGKPVWKSSKGEIAAAVLAMGRTNRFFSAKTNVAMKLPAGLFKKNLDAGQTTNTLATNQFVDISCDTFSFATNVAHFDKNVRASMIDENGSRTLLTCDSARVSFGTNNQVETIFADKNVVLQEIPGAALQSDILEKIITCESLTVNRSSLTEAFESIHAKTDVIGKQIERTKLGEMVKRISADVVDVKFAPATNQIENAVATGNVSVTKIELIGATNNTVNATGEKAVYRLADEQETVELTGQPLAWTDKVLFSDALVMILDVKSGKISARPYKVTPLNSTDDLKSLLKSSQP